MGWLNFGGKKRKQGKGFGNSQQRKSRKPRKTFVLEKIVTPSAGVGGWLEDFDSLHQLLGSLPLPDLDLPNFLADSGVCPIDPSGAPTNNLPPLIDFDPLGLYHDGIATQTPYNPGGAFETLPVALIPVDPHSPNPNNPNAIRQLLNFPLASQPLVGSIDTGVSADSPYLNYANIKKGRDYVGGDDNPLLKAGEGSEHGTFMLGIVDAINKTAPKWVGRAIDSGRWADSLVEFVDAARASGQKNAIANLSLDLTQKNADGSVTTRYELTTAERSAIEYARQNGVMLVVAAGNDGGVMSVLGQASQEFDNIFTVGAGDINGRSNYSSYGRGLDILADGGTNEHPSLSTAGNDLGTMAGTSVATAKVAGAASLVWAANPALNYRQVMEILKSTARDLGPSGWDDETGFGFLNTLAAVDLAKKTTPEVYNPTPWVTPDTWSGQGKVTPEERAAQGGTSFNTAPFQLSPNFTDSGIVSPAQPALYHTFTVTEPGYFRYTVNRTNGSTQLPLISVVKPDGKPGGFEFIPGEPSGDFNSVGLTISAETFEPTKVQTPVSKTAAVFLEPGTYAVKVASGGWDSSVKNYGLTTELIPDRPSAFSGYAQFRIPLQNNFSGMFTSAPTSPELNVPAVSYYQYGIEVNDPVKFTLNSQSNIGDADIEIRKLLGSGEQWESITTYSTDGSQPIDLNLNLNKGRYKIYVKTTVPLKGSVTPLVADPDGSLATARNIGTLSSNQIKFSDSIGGLDKSDFYRFDVSQPSEVALYLKRLQGNSDIKLLDAQGKEIDKTYNPSGTNPSDVIFNTVNAGTYYVQVFSSNSANANYELKLDATPVASSGTPQSGGSSVSIGASPVPNTGGGSVTIGASPIPNTGGGSVNIGASPVEQPVAPQPGQGGVPLNAGNFQYTATSNGVTTHYYTNGYLTIQPTGYKTWYGTSSSSSVATVETLGKPTQAIPDANRQLGEFIGRYEYKGRLRTGDNTDGYYFAVKDRSLLNLALRNLGADASLKLYKVNPNASKSLIREAPAAGQGFDKLWSETLDTGNYYVEVNKGSAAADTDYTMVLNLAKTLNDANPNNFKGESNPFFRTFTGRTVMSGNLSSSNSAKKLSANVYANDRYRLDINNLGSQSPNILRLGLNDLAPNSTAKVVVYDGNNQPVKEQLFYPGQNSPLEVSGLAEGLYFVGVEQVQGDTPYNLAVQLDQAGEDWSRVRNLGDLTGQRKEYEDFVGATRDGSDYYKFTIKDSRLLQLAPRLFDSDNPAGVKVELYDANKKLVTFTENNPIYKADLAAGDYYVKVVPASGNDTNYRLVVNLTQKGSKSNRLEQLVAKSTLTLNEIVEYRQLVAQLPQSDRASWYRKLQYLIPYFNQRDNGHRDIEFYSNNNPVIAADVMCQLTSLASALTYLGIPNPNPNKQFEDALEDLRVTKKLDRYDYLTLEKLAKSFNVSTELNHSYPTKLNMNQGRAEAFKQHAQSKWASALNEGKAVVLSAATTRAGHIVKLVGITPDGIIVDDPWGKIKDSGLKTKQSGNYQTLNSKSPRSPNTNPNDTQLGKNEIGVGNDVFWSWANCAKIFDDGAYELILSSKSESSTPSQPATGSNQVPTSNSQSSPSSSSKDMARNIFAITAAFEGDGFKNLTGNFDKQGISFGFLQWNFGQGSLPPVLKKMYDRDPAKFRDIFSSDTDYFLNVLNAKANEQMQFARQINDKNNKVIEPWKSRFIKLGEYGAFQDVQIEFANNLFKQAKKAAGDYGLKTQRGLALMFDIVVQNGSVNPTAKTNITKETKNKEKSLGRSLTERELLEIIALAVANASNPKYINDVKARKMTIVNGKGVVHKTSFDLDKDFGLSDQLWE